MDALGGIGFVPKVHGRPHLVHPHDGRWERLKPSDLTAFVGDLAKAIDPAGIDYVLGLPEGGLVPAFAFAQVIDRPLVLSTRLRLRRDPVISFEEPHSPQGTTHYVYGLRPGARVVIIEDEITTGRTVINAARALRAAGVHIDQAGVLLAVDSEERSRRMADEGIALHVLVSVPPDRGEPATAS